MNTKETIKFLGNNQNSLLIIHYSCQNLNDSNEAYSPRITSIAVFHVGSSTMHSFSIHLMAEIDKIQRDDIEQHYDNLEAKMLQDFFDFAKSKPDCYWLHWNMSNINFGFETLEHRYRVLTQKQPPKIDDSKKYNLSALINAAYGKECVADPKMPRLMELNGGKHRDFLTGLEEVAAFKNKEYLKLHKSTMCKVYWFHSMFIKLLNRKIKTDKSNLTAKINSAAESWPAKLAGIIALGFTLFQIVETGWKYAGEAKMESLQTREAKGGKPSPSISTTK